MPTTSDLCGGFWDGSYQSDVADAYSSIAFALSESDTRLSPGRIRAWTINQADLVIGSVNGRVVYGYPRPLNDPIWIAADLIGSPIRSRRQDFDFDSIRVWFDADPFEWATVSQLVWVNGVSVLSVSLFYCSVASQPTTSTNFATWSALTQAVASGCDSPAALGNEMVKDIWQDANSDYHVVTDQNVYTLNPLDAPSVVVGQSVTIGRPLGTAWTLTPLGPSLPDLAYLTTPAYYQQNATTGGITHYNTTVPTIIDTVLGRTRIRWQLGGTLSDVNAFWAASQATGTLPGAKTLAQAMDTRANPVGDPGPNSLPPTVNPLAFVCRNLFAGNAYLLLVLPERCGPAALTDSARRVLVQQAAGPYVAIFEYLDSMPALTPTNPT